MSLWVLVAAFPRGKYLGGTDFREINYPRVGHVLLAGIGKSLDFNGYTTSYKRIPYFWRGNNDTPTRGSK